MRYRASVFYGLVFKGGELGSDAMGRGVEFPRIDGDFFAVAAAESYIPLDQYRVVGARPIPINGPTEKWDAILRAWCDASEREWSQPRWWACGAVL